MAMKKMHLGIFLGFVAGVIDMVPMIIQNLTWDANLSALSLWIASGFLISTSSLKINGAFKGILISFIVLIPSAVLIGWKEPMSLIPIFVITLILGSLLGFFVEKYGK